jgi:hypothetical protein
VRTSDQLVCNLNEALDLGHQIMSNSEDLAHNMIHAKEVECHARKIFEELYRSNTNKLDLELDWLEVGLAVWWHDCYKATVINLGWKEALFEEGKLSARMTRQHLQKLVPAEMLSRILVAIEQHHKLLIYGFRKKNFPLLSRILIEADCLDILRKSRFITHYSQSRGIMWKIGITINYLLLPFLLPLLLRSSYARQYFRGHLPLFSWASSQRR